jgi:hypothetical protein
VGAHLFAEEVRAGMVERETELRERLGLALDGPLELTSATEPAHQVGNGRHALEGTY